MEIVSDNNQPTDTDVYNCSHDIILNKSFNAKN